MHAPSTNMQVRFPDQAIDGFESLRSQLDDWTYQIVPRRFWEDDANRPADYWLGCTQDGQIWGLVREPRKGKVRPQTLVAVLFEPEKRQSGPIGRILMLAYFARERDGSLSDAAIDEILRQSPFRSYDPVASFLPDAPVEWLHLPAYIGVDVSLSEGAGVNAEIMSEFARDTVEGVVSMVCGPRHDGVLFHYALIAAEVVPMLGWEVDWLLARRGEDPPTRRGKVQAGVLPWESEFDPTLFTLYQDVRGVGYGGFPHYWAAPTVRLRVGGRTPDAAIENWHRCARALRKLRRKVATST